jgi:two-component system, OmpR family, sensor histidine kinase VicK
MGIFGKKGDKDNSQVAKLSGALKNKEALSEILIQSISDGIIATDTLGTIILINNAAGSLTEWSTEEAGGIDSKLVVKLLSDEKATQIIPDNEHPFTTVLQTRKAYSQTVLLVSRNNKRTYVSLAISPVLLPKNDELVGTVAVFRDVNAERSQEQRSADFISTASHEMRTPVAAIEGYLALALNEKVSSIDPRAREYLEKAHSSTQHLGKLFQDLLTSAKAEDGRLTSHPVVTEMGAFLEQLTEDLKFSAEKKGLGVEFIYGTPSDSTSHKLPIDGQTNVGKSIAPLYYANVDPDRMREVIANVFDNGVKYSESGKIKVGITGDTHIIQIHISDNGPGIPKEDLPHLFQKFYRVDNSATRSIGGTGLGLYICGAIVQLYNGTIWAESKVGEGSTFYINLPRLSSQQAAHLQSLEKTTPQL